jgi:hypothetical protein
MFSRLVFASAAALALLSHTISAQVSFQNPSFEMCMGGLPMSWTQGGTGQPVQCSAVRAHTGTISALYSLQSFDNSSLSQDVSVVQAGQPITVSFWLYLENPPENTDPADLQLFVVETTFTNPDGTTTTQTAQPQLVKGSNTKENNFFYQYTTTFTAPNNPTQATVNIKFESVAPSCTIYLDDVSIVAVVSSSSSSSTGVALSSSVVSSRAVSSSVVSSSAVSSSVVSSSVPSSSAQSSTAQSSSAQSSSAQSSSAQPSSSSSSSTGATAVSSSILATSSSSSAAVVGDPSFVGLRGQHYQVHGIDGEVYNLITSQTTQINSRFVFLTEGQCPLFDGIPDVNCWSHAGSHMGEIAIQQRVNDHVHQLLIVSGPAQRGFLSITLNGKAMQVNDTVVDSDVFAVSYVTSHQLTCTQR